VLEYIEGNPLKGPLPTEEAVRLAIRIKRGVIGSILTVYSAP
jgi:hypothetical protein